MRYDDDETPESLGLVPMGEEKKPSKPKPKKTVVPARRRRADDEDRSIPPVYPRRSSRPPPPVYDDDETPESLGLRPVRDPIPAPSPVQMQVPQQEEPEEDTFTWGQHKAWEFVDTVMSAVTGLEPDVKKPSKKPRTRPKPKWDMTRIEDASKPAPIGAVPDGKVFAPGTVGDWVMPDWFEYPVRSLYDFYEAPRTQENLAIGEAKSGHWYLGQLANVAEIGKDIGDAFISGAKDDNLGGAQAAVDVANFIGDFVNEHLVPDGSPKWSWAYWEDQFRTKAEEYGREAEARQKRMGQAGVSDYLIQAAPMLPVMLAEFGGAGALMGPAKGWAAIEAIGAYNEGPEATVIAALEGYALGKFFDWTSVLSRPLRLPVLAATGYGLSKAAGAEEAEAEAQGILFPLLSLPEGGGPVGIRYLRKHGIVRDLQEVRAHIRDLFLGGSKERTEAEAVEKKTALDNVQTRHNQEKRSARERHDAAVAEARKPQEGDGPTSVQDRIDTEKRRFEDEVKDMGRRHEEEEQPFRQDYEHADRRARRAKHPLRVSWKEHPYMVALHDAEQRVLVAFQNGWDSNEGAKKEAADNLEASRAEAAEIRKNAESETDPEKRAEMLKTAEEIETEGDRLDFESRARVEDGVEDDIWLAEAEAQQRRWELVDVIMRANKVEGRRAAYLAASRDLDVALNHGVRITYQGQARARRLLAMGDEYVERTKQHLRERGVAEGSTEWISEVEAAHNVREIYRTQASIELLDSMYKTHSWISRARKNLNDVAKMANAAGIETPRADTSERASRRLSADEKRWRERRAAAEDETKPDDAKKEDKPDWDPAPQDEGNPEWWTPENEEAYRRALGESQEDAKLGEIVRRIEPYLDRIESTRDVLPLINEIAKEIEHDPSRHTRGRQSQKSREELAAELGMTEEQLLDTPAGRAFNDYEIEAALWLLRRAWERAQRSYNLWKRNPGSEIARRVFINDLTRFVMIRNVLRGAAAESGRSLRMWRKVKEEFGGIRDDLTDDAYDRIMLAEGKKRNKILDAILEGSWIDMITEIYIGGLLSSLQTAFVSVFGGLIMLPYRLIQSFVAAILGLRRGAFRKAGKQKGLRTRVPFGETSARARGMMGALPEAVMIFFKSLWTGKPYLKATNYGERLGKVPWWLGGPIWRLPGRLLMAIDDAVKVLAYRSARRGLAYRQAVADANRVEGSKKFRNVWEKRRWIKNRFQQLVKDPTASIEGAARREALELTFQQNVEGGFAKGVGRWRMESKIAPFIIPFHRVLFNSLEFILTGTPLGILLYKRFREDIMGKNGAARQDMAIAHMILVSGTAYLVYGWAMAGNVKGPVRDPKDRAAGGVSTEPPFSVRIPGTDQWVGLNRVDPAGAVVAMGYAAAKMRKNAENEANLDKQADAFTQLLYGITNMSLERSGMAGVAQFLDLLRGGQYGSDTGAAERWASQLLANLGVPQGVSVYARTQDPYLRYADTLSDRIANRLPRELKGAWGVDKTREDLPPIRNIWGSPIKGYDSYNGNFVLNMTMPVYWGTTTKDPASKFMLKQKDLYGWFPEPPKRDIEGRKLTPEEYDVLAKRAGNLLYPRIRAIAESDLVTQLIPAKQAEIAALREQIRDKFGVKVFKGMEDGKEGKGTVVGYLFNDPGYKAALRLLDQKRKELGAMRLQALKQAQNATRESRKQARKEFIAQNPAFLDRPKANDPRRVIGDESGEEYPWWQAWLDWLDASGEQEEATAEDNLRDADETEGARDDELETTP